MNSDSGQVYHYNLISIFVAEKQGVIYFRDSIIVALCRNIRNKYKLRRERGQSD